MKRVTIKDVAREAGVSFSAVSRAFTEGASVAPATRARIEAAARRLNYRPSNVARSLVSSRTNLVTLVTGRMADPFDTIFLETLCDALADRGVRLLLAPASRQTAEGGGLLQALDDQADAAIVSAGTMSLEASERCVRAGLPVVLAGRAIEAEGIDCVLAENADGGRQAAELFLRTGRRRLGFFGQPRETFSDRERGEGFLRAAAAAGAQPAVFRAEIAEDEAIFEAALRTLSTADRPDAVFCSTDRLALAAIEAARALGLSTPGDLSVIGFNNIPAAARRSFRLTTLDYPVARVVGEIVALLERRLAEPEAEACIRRIPVQMVVRDTTAGGAG